MKLTYYGHAAFSVFINQTHLLFDPFISGNEKAAHINILNLQPDYILLSHGHGDHIGDAIEIAQNSGAMVVSSFEVVSWLQQKGVQRIHPMNHGGNKVFDFGKIKYVNAVHSSILPDGAYGGNPGGFVVQSEDKAFYFAGDTALTLDMQLIPRFARLDLAILPIGDNFTMGYEDALIAADFVQCNQVLGIHYNTFPPIEIDTQKAKETFQKAGKDLILMEIGEEREF